MYKRVKREDLIEPELSYRIVGVLFRVYNELGPGLHEKYYQRACTAGFEEQTINFKQQAPIPMKFLEKEIGKYFADFIVDEKVIVELKAGNQINRKHAKQVIAYLKSTGLQLGILAYFGKDGVFFKRIINIPEEKNPLPSNSHYSG
ncbi:MAG: GxxExxY protein [Bacteroidetes bacterium]|nr:GxxExxY protein [Bacteroidota bacterium]